MSELKDPMELLSDEERQRLLDDLAQLAKQRREAEVNCRNIVLS